MKLHAYTTTIKDGSMKSVHRDTVAASNQNRAHFLELHSLPPRDTTLVRLVYEGDNYTRYVTLSEHDKGDGIVRSSTIIADALVSTKPGHVLFLPLADCIGAVIHDTAQDILMLSHLGRHNLEQYGGTKSIDYLIEEHGSTPENITVWLSPAAGQNYYPLFAFDNRSLHDVAVEQLTAAGVSEDAIEVSPVDSAKDATYFSHSQFLKGQRETDGRFAVMAVLSED